MSKLRDIWNQTVNGAFKGGKWGFIAGGAVGLLGGIFSNPETWGAFMYLGTGVIGGLAGAGGGLVIGAAIGALAGAVYGALKPSHEAKPNPVPPGQEQQRERQPEGPSRTQTVEQHPTQRQPTRQQTPARQPVPRSPQVDDTMQPPMNPGTMNQNIGQLPLDPAYSFPSVATYSDMQQPTFVERERLRKSRARNDNTPPL